MEDEIVYEIDWRIKEISILKSLPYLKKFSEEQYNTYYKHLFPALYSLWEGYVCATFEIYIRELNSKLLIFSNLHENLRTYLIDSELQLSNPRLNFDTKFTFVSKISVLTKDTVKLSTKLPTESNVNYKVLSKIFRNLNLNIISISPFEKDLDKLLLIRNKIAHGEYSIQIDKDEFSRLSQSIIDIMIEVYLAIMEGYNSKSYLASDLPLAL
jgi:hypothetical protein